MIDTSFLPKAIEGHMQVQQNVVDMWLKIKDHTSFRSMIEIGFNVGHSSVIVLSLFDDVSVNSFDINRNERTQQGAEIVKEKFNNRHNFYSYNTLTLREDINNKNFALPNADLIFIDGGHSFEVALNNIMIAKENNISYVVVDDSNIDEVRSAINAVDFLTEIETWTYVYQKKKNKINPVTCTLFKLTECKI